MTHQAHDHSFKNIFSHSLMVEHLIRGFMPGAWISELDFRSLQPYKNEYISDDLKKRQNDSVWRIDFRGEWLYLMVILEFQSSVDRWMAIRLTTYSSLLLEALIKSKQLIDKRYLPPILGIVFYTGSKPWTAPEQSRDLLVSGAPALLQSRFPSFRYDVVDVGHYTLSEQQREDTRNLILPLIELEQNAEDMDTVIDCIARLEAGLAASNLDSLRRAFVLYLYRSLNLRKRCPKLNPEKLQLEEFTTMLRDRLDAREARLMEEAMLKGMQKGMQKGMEQGVQKGREQGMQRAVMNMILKGVDPDVISEVSGYSKEELNNFKSRTDILDS